MWSCTIERVIEGNGGVARIAAEWFPLDGREGANEAPVAVFALPTAARQTDRSHLADLSFFRDFVLTDCNRARNHRTVTLVTVISGKV